MSHPGATTEAAAPTFATALVGVDAGPGGRDALALAGQLAAHLIVAHIHPSERDGRQRALALVRAEIERAGLDVRAVDVAELDGRPGDGLHELAAHHGAPLVVIGSSRRHGLGRLVHGDDTRATLHAAQTAVAVAPAGWSDTRRPLERVGVGWTGDPASGAALRLARAVTRGASVRVVEAISLPERSSTMTDAEAYAAAWYPGSAADVERAQARLDELGLDGRAVAGFGGPVLTDATADLDLLVVGNDGRGPIWRWLAESVPDGLVRTARCPLLVAEPIGVLPPRATGA